MDLVVGGDDGSREIFSALPLLALWCIGTSSLDLEGFESLHSEFIDATYINSLYNGDSSSYKLCLHKINSAHED